MRQHRFRTRSKASRLPSGLQERKLVPLLQGPRRILRSTSASTRPCCTTPSTATSAHCILATSTDSLFSCMRSWATPRMRTGQWSSGAMPIQGVRLLQHRRITVNIDMHRSRKRCLHSGMLHGAHSVMATSSCFGTHRADGPTLHAFPRCWIQPG
jgi:hypothetical protein